MIVMRQGEAVCDLFRCPALQAMASLPVKGGSPWTQLWRCCLHDRCHILHDNWVFGSCQLEMAWLLFSLL